MNRIIVLSLTVIILFTACNKDDLQFESTRNCNAAGDGKITTLINDTAWTACEFKAVYYSKAQVLCIDAVEQNSNIELRFFITVDTINPLKAYSVNSKSNSGLEIIQGLRFINPTASDIYFCDLPQAGVGGTINITTLDTAASRVTATFNINGYSQTQQKLIRLTNGIIDSKLTRPKKDTATNSYIRADIDGTPWYAKPISFIKRTYTGTRDSSYLEVKAMGYPEDLGDCPPLGFAFPRNTNTQISRNLSFILPLNLPAGTYPLNPYKVATPTPLNFLFAYNQHNYIGRYFPVAGSTITITSNDSANRRIDLNFTGMSKDSLGNGLNFTRGKIHVEGYVR